MHVLHFHNSSSVFFQGSFWIPLLISLRSLFITPLLLHQSPVSHHHPYALPPFLHPLPHRDARGHHFPSRQRGLLRRDRQWCRHTVTHTPSPTPHTSARTLTCALRHPRGGGDLRDEWVRDGDLKSLLFPVVNAFCHWGFLWSAHNGVEIETKISQLPVVFMKNRLSEQRFSLKCMKILEKPLSFCPSLFFFKSNELELNITFSWMAKAKLTEQFVCCYITSLQQTPIVQLHTPKPALQRRYSHWSCVCIWMSRF